MSNIVDALKAKFGGKGQSIAEVVKTMEGSGSGGGGVFLITNANVPEQTIARFDKTWKEIHDAFLAGKQCVVFWDQSDDDNTSVSWSPVIELYNRYGSYKVGFSYGGSITIYYCNSEDGYPECNYD